MTVEGALRTANYGLPRVESKTGQHILLVAGEASGDIHGADLVTALKLRLPGVQVSGVGGYHLREAGMNILVDSATIAGMGLFEATDKLSALVRTYRQLTTLLRTHPPDLLVLIDFPEFNLRLAKAAKKAGVRVFYYISPQVWAWRRRRVYTIAQRVDQLAVVFPFEPDFYAAHGCSATFVGHPLVDRVHPTRSREETLLAYGFDPTRRTVALLPGSRSQEVEYLLDLMLQATNLLGTAYQFVLAVASTLDRENLASHINTHYPAIRVIQGDTYNLIHAADIALVASGTATLETALLERPMVITYRLAPLTYALARLLVHVPFMGMPNLIAGQQIVPELLQKQVTPARIAAEAQRLLENPQAYRMAQEGLRTVRSRLGPGGAADRTAALICTMLEKTP